MGKPIRHILENNASLRDYVVFGFHGREIIVNDGKYLCMCAPENADDPYYEYTLMPTHMRARFSCEELKDWTVAEPFSCTKGLKPIRCRCTGSTVGNATSKTPRRLFNLEKDPGQLHEIEKPEVVKHMKELIRQYMVETDAPKELYHRYGIAPVETEV